MIPTISAVVFLAYRFILNGMLGSPLVKLLNTFSLIGSPIYQKQGRYTIHIV
jgi:hypothetical protein